MSPPIFAAQLLLHSSGCGCGWRDWGSRHSSYIQHLPQFYRTKHSRAVFCWAATMFLAMYLVDILYTISHQPSQTCLWQVPQTLETSHLISYLPHISEMSHCLQGNSPDSSSVLSNKWHLFSIHYPVPASSPLRGHWCIYGVDVQECLPIPTLGSSVSSKTYQNETWKNLKFLNLRVNPGISGTIY